MSVCVYERGDGKVGTGLLQQAARRQARGCEKGWSLLASAVQDLNRHVLFRHSTAGDLEGGYRLPGGSDTNSLAGRCHGFFCSCKDDVASPHFGALSSLENGTRLATAAHAKPNVHFPQLQWMRNGSLGGVQSVAATALSHTSPALGRPLSISACRTLRRPAPSRTRD